ncbi:bifunctional Type II pantothenate kinase/ATPase [Babesia duncani]|uniref:Bifunctional Type II pantothenate kinase/ATPase n=1 Tax=Babesia duncani TaxID=323732 RepID=A0AAD9UPD1_9APIC|nr:bifunctional Type II pantothenate kinase/ATPase [Babesia duncani]
MGNLISVDYRKNIYGNRVNMYILVNTTFNNKDDICSLLEDYAKHLGALYSLQWLNYGRFWFFKLVNVDLNRAVSVMMKYENKLNKIMLYNSHLYPILRDKFPKIAIELLDEEQCLFRGIHDYVSSKGTTFILKTPTLESKTDNGAIISEANLQYPFILVRLDAGVSFYKIDENNVVKCLGYSPIGTDAIAALFEIFDRNSQVNNISNVNINEIMEFAKIGANAKCDILVSDIYGGSYDEVSLPDDLIASSLGKLQHFSFKRVGSAEDNKMTEIMQSNVDSSVDSMSKRTQDSKDFQLSDKGSSEDGYSVSSVNSNDIRSSLPLQTSEFAKLRPSKEDFAKSLALMLAINVSQHAFLHTTLCDAKCIVMIGEIFENEFYRETMDYWVKFWSQKSVECLFVRQPSIVGLVGACLIGN